MNFEVTLSVNILVSDAPTWQAASAVSALQYLILLALVGPCRAVRLKLRPVQYVGCAYFSILCWIGSRLWK